jgi:hypothetical protein
MRAVDDRGLLGLKNTVVAWPAGMTPYPAPYWPPLDPSVFVPKCSISAPGRPSFQSCPDAVADLIAARGADRGEQVDASCRQR